MQNQTHHPHYLEQLIHDFVIHIVGRMSNLDFEKQFLPADPQKNRP